VKRRHVLALAGAATLSPSLVRAQGAWPVIGYLSPASAGPWGGRVDAFKKGLAEAGFVEGKNVAIEYRWADGQTERLADLAMQLVDRKVAVIVTPGSAPAALAAKKATQQIPIVFETGADPVAIGLVPNLGRPGGNITGVTALSFELGPKRLEIVHEAVPGAKVVGVLMNPASPFADKLTTVLQDAARGRSVELVMLHARSDGDFEPAFVALRQRGAQALVTHPDPYLNSRAEQLAAMSVRHALPTVFHFRGFATAGGLMSYGGDIGDTHRLAGVYAGRILKGDKPADLPVQQSSKVELVVNMRTAKALNLSLPSSLVGRADEVIE
jgi:putative ABC transport system substrate-binding protein